ncbi:MAG: type II secretion system protein GspC [Deltaproteobacteria bacterium]|nr:type II secretion system protein GspC [Deltaproteobacteria bacterium]
MSFFLKKYMWAISLGAVILCSYFLAKMTANLISMQFESHVGGAFLSTAVTKPLAPKKEGMGEETFRPILERNVFNSKAAGLPADTPEGEGGETGEPVDLTGEATPTSLGVKLVSTFSVGDGTDNRSSCIISSGKGEGEVYIVADEKKFAPDTKIVKILYNRVEFVNKGRLEYVELEDFAKGGIALNSPPSDEESPKVVETKDSQPAEKAPGGTMILDRAEIDDALANLDKLYTQIRAVPHFKEGKPDGLKLLSVRSGSLFSKLGLTRGDILKRINGMDLDIKKGLEIFGQLKSETKLTVDLERKGAPQTMEYEIR